MLYNMCRIVVNINNKIKNSSSFSCIFFYIIIECYAYDDYIRKEILMRFKKIIVNFTCNFGDKLKPVLIKILPLSLLKKIKKNIIHSAYNADTKKVPYQKDAYPFGINLIGFIKAQMGLGQGCRLIASAIEKTGFPFTIMDTKVGNPFNHNDTTWESYIVKEAQYSINIFHVNPEQMPPLQLSLPVDTLDKRYNIGIWLWELPDFPDEWCNAFSLVDEVWAPSVFNCESIRKKSNVPVTLIPYGIVAEYDEKYDREFFNLPTDKFLFLSMYDSNSTIQRKNPIGAIRAFKNAFSPDDDNVGLAIKINNPSDEDLATINDELSGYNNVYLIKNTMSKIEVNSLIRAVDVLVSLHRAEGFGLVIAESMLVGTPVIATNWSANVDFMNEENSCPVNYELKQLGEDIFFYKAYQHWAEPDVNNAAEYMKRLVSDKEYYEKLCKNAKEFIETNFSVEKSAQAIQRRINEIIK